MAKCLYFWFSGEVGKEMYICARGRLEVVVDEGKTVLATLKAGSYFGEISILNMGTAGQNQRFLSCHFVITERRTLIKMNHSE